MVAGVSSLTFRGMSPPFHQLRTVKTRPILHHVYRIVTELHWFIHLVYLSGNCVFHPQQALHQYVISIKIPVHIGNLQSVTIVVIEGKPVPVQGNGIVKVPHEIILINMTNVLLQHTEHMLGDIHSAAVGFFYHGSYDKQLNWICQQQIAPVSCHNRAMSPSFHSILHYNYPEYKGCKEIFSCYHWGTSAVSLNMGASVAVYCLTSIKILCYPMWMTENRIGVS